MKFVIRTGVFSTLLVLASVGVLNKDF